MQVYEIYCDGAYSYARNQGGIGIIFTSNCEIIGQFSKCYKNTTNNRMELTAVIIALKSIKKPIDKLIIYSDSQYVIKTITDGWKRNKNINLWKTYDKVFDEALNLCKSIEFKWVKGHNSNTFNNLADNLAVKASQEFN